MLANVENTVISWDGLVHPRRAYDLLRLLHFYIEYSVDISKICWNKIVNCWKGIRYILIIFFLNHLLRLLSSKASCNMNINQSLESNFLSDWLKSLFQAPLRVHRYYTFTHLNKSLLLLLQIFYNGFSNLVILKQANEG